MSLSEQDASPSPRDCDEVLCRDPRRPRQPQPGPVRLHRPLRPQSGPAQHGPGPGVPGAHAQPLGHGLQDQGRSRRSRNEQERAREKQAKGKNIV